jgi:hypothetical protein
MADIDTTPTDQVRQAIAQFLERTEPEVICIRGAWGVGKTYAWKAALEASAASGKIGLDTYSYVSLFGVTSLEQLKYSIFENRTTGSTIAKAADMETFGRGIDSPIKTFGTKAIEALAGKTASDLVQAGAFLMVRNQIVCIDDIERKGKDLRTIDILGLISMLIEERNCKVAIILNDEQLLDEKMTLTVIRKKLSINRMLMLLQSKRLPALRYRAPKALKSISWTEHDPLRSRTSAC